MTTSRQFHAQRQKKVKMQAFEIYHPAIGFVRYVGGQFYEQSLTMRDGSTLTFQPIQAKFGLPNMSEFSTLSMKVDIGRVGTKVKEKLELIDAYNKANPNTTSTNFNYYEFIDGIETYSLKMWVKDFAMDGQNVAIIASDDNPAMINVSEVYTAQRFPGLEVLS